MEPSEFLALEVWYKTRDPFKVLIATILTQNTTDKGAKRAYEELEREVGVTPDKLSSAEIDKIKNCIKSIGLYNNKAKIIKTVSTLIMEQYGGDLENLLDLDQIESRQRLVELPGIGKKTADVVMLTCKGYRVFPVDTHILRVSERLGIKGGYDKVSEFWKESLGSDLLEAHLILITHGRKTCKAINPKCNSCSINDCCRYYAGLRRS
ncbi:endonuclease III domain-containing protein [Metallosphaera hakonensis]|uniref:endonuclease III domain-containing protein n=1 Tax=Metallosphaera hakonensis TaxID=79601 RepID=UPI0006D0D247|nr:endonuclease III [Metallosphaera hakonensis]